MEMMVNESDKAVDYILGIFKESAYRAGKCETDTPEYAITKTCEDLLKLDYKVAELDNTDGRLCPMYPSRIPIPFAKVKPNEGSKDFNANDQKLAQLNNYLHYAKYARCRRRFVVPVIFYQGKCICRSATISVKEETYARKAIDLACNFVFQTYYGKSIDTSKSSGPIVNNSKGDDVESSSISNNSGSSYNGNEEGESSEDLNGCPFSYDEVISKDVELLKFLNVDTIVDLMVEFVKVKYFLTVTSSEKAQSHNKYKDFKILAIPYPGCEFYSIYRKNNYNPESLYYDWTQGFIDAKVELPENGPAQCLNINWNEYKSWDLALITQNYLKAILKYIQDEDQGLLIHCISGWDRTPLFISLVRLSLWADGLIHRSLNPYQITYFTIAYDWYLFGHQLPARLSKGEDIMFFCFDFLKYIGGEDFVVNCRRRRSKTPSHDEIWESFSHTDISANCGGLESDVFMVTNEDTNDGIRNDCDNNASSGLDTINANLTSQSPHAKRSRTNSTSNTSSDLIDGSWEDLSTVQKEDQCTKDDRAPLPMLSCDPKSSPIKANFYNFSSIKMSPIKSSSTKMTAQSIQNSKVGATTSSAAPVEIPGGGHHRRKRTESESSFVMVTEVGSVESKESTSGPSKDEIAARRKKRLTEVRKIFISAYHRCIGMRFPKNSTVTLANFVGEIANQAAEIYNTMITTTTVEEKEEEVEAESKT